VQVDDWTVGTMPTDSVESHLLGPVGTTVRVAIEPQRVAWCAQAGTAGHEAPPTRAGPGGPSPRSAVEGMRGAFADAK
jgi:hypothetical protein